MGIKGSICHRGMGGTEGSNEKQVEHLPFQKKKLRYKMNDLKVASL
jgi:hypothetical protein